MESSKQREERKTKEHINPGNGDRHEKNEQELDKTRKEGPGQSGLENAGRRPMGVTGVRCCSPSSPLVSSQSLPAPIYRPYMATNPVKAPDNNFSLSEFRKQHQCRENASVCNTTVHLAATNIKSCYSDSIKSSVPNHHLSLSTISKYSVDSYSSSELNETQNSCETTVSNQSTYQISHVILPDMVFPNNSLISDEIPCKFEENMLNEPCHD
ncbi:unnamed protein product [Schistosoma margrebowiei]|uniref:Uncharacterized protein n=1 Tax=Schistosoma margrebowiei TaxID=48269 RepID=A0A183MU93_9TREM|nr:unnamed protein product [Schistosoma margrebowiei]